MLEKITQSISDTLRTIAGKSTISEKNIEEAVEQIKIALLDADVNLRVVRRFVNHTINEAKGARVTKSVQPGQEFVKIIYDRIVRMLGGDLFTGEGKTPFALKNPDTLTTVVFAGLQGSGKTTSCAKLALFLQKQNRRVLLCASDTVRPAAIDQLIQLGKEIQTEVFSADKKDAVNNAKLAVEYARKNQFDTLIIDTAGRLEVDDALMTELSSICSAVKSDHVLFVLDSAAGQSAVESARVFNERLPITGAVLTKFDGDARGGAALSFASITEKPILFTGTGEHLTDFEKFFPDRTASRILGMGDVVSLVEKAREQFDNENLAKLQERAARNEYTLQDMLDQFKEMHKMGSMESIAQMIPGMAGQKIDKKLIRHGEAIIQSMTIKERANHLIIGPSRRRRIAKGSGTSLAEVNKLLKQFEQAKLVMKKLSRNKGMQAAMLKGLGIKMG